MTGIHKSCTTMQPIYRNNATAKSNATISATASNQTSRKPASIRELRTQLLAQRACNSTATQNCEVAQPVASESESCIEKGYGYGTCNCATEIVGPYTPWTPPVSPTLVAELHRLIARYADTYRLTEEESARIIAIAKRQPAATVPESVEFFKKSLKEKS